MLKNTFFNANKEENMNQVKLFESIYRESMEDAVIPFNDVKSGMTARDSKNIPYTIKGKDSCHGFGDDPDNEDYFECEGVRILQPQRLPFR